jgi:hypothetical protein
MQATRFAFALAAGLFFTAAAPAAEFRGVISALDLKKNELRVERRGLLRSGTVTFRISRETQVRFGSDPGVLKDLEVGRRVRVVAEPGDDRPVAELIRVLGPRPNHPVARVAADVVAGVLRRVALTDRELVVIGPGAKGPETETTVSVPESVKIQRGDTTVKFEMLKEGEQVAVRVAMRDGRRVAVEVQVGPGAATAAAAMPSSQSPVLPKVRLLLKIADQVLEQVEKGEKGKP